MILCDLEGKSIQEATRQLGWPQGTLAGRLARGRTTCLTANSAWSGLVWWLPGRSAFAEHGVGLNSDYRSSRRSKPRVLIAANTVIGVISPKVAALTEGNEGNDADRLKTMATVLLVVALFGIGVEAT